MSSVNKVIIVGNLGADPETRQFGNGGSVTNIAVATSERWTDKQSGEKREATEWHKISLFNRLGEVAAQYLRKGSKVYIEGSLRTNKYQDKNGQDRYSTEIRANELVMLDSAGGGQNNGGFSGQQSSQSNGGYNQPNQGGQNNYTGQQTNNQPPAQNGYNPSAANKNPQGGYQDSYNNTPNTFNQQNAASTNQFTAPAANANNGMANKTNAMPSPPVDDDIPF